MAGQKTKIFERDLLDKLKKLLDRKEIFAVKGPRQSGKTTLLRQLEKYLVEEKKVSREKVVFINLEDRIVLDQFYSSPKDFVKSYLTQKGRYFFFFDEYQYVPDGGQKLKLLYDSFTNVKFIISGSSSLELTNQTAKYLVGRLFSFHLYPLSFKEFVRAKDKRLLKYFLEKQEKVKQFLFKEKKFKIKKDIFLQDIQKLFEEYVLFGAYPEVVKTKQKQIKKIVLKNIINTYLEKDIISLLKIGDYQQFKDLAILLAASTGNLINYEQLGNETRLYFQQLKKYLSILEQTYIIKLLKPFFRNLKTELKKNPKIYFLDLGLRNYLVDNFAPLKVRPDKGYLVESVILSNLIYSFSDLFQYRFWRTLKGAEVDFVLKKGEKIFPIEIKYRQFRRPKIDRGFRNFLKFYQPKTAVVVTQDYWNRAKVEKSLVYFVPACYL